MHKVIEEKPSGWYVVYMKLECMKDGIYQGSYKNLDTAKSNHPNAEVIHDR